MRAVRIQLVIVSLVLSGCVSPYVVNLEKPARLMSPPWEVFPQVELRSKLPSGFATHCQPGLGTESYRLPMKAVRLGGYVLRAVHIGTSDEFERFEANPGGLPAPVSLEFDRAERAHPIVFPEDTVQSADITVFPSSYVWEEESELGHCNIRFVGSDPVLGEVRFEAREVDAPPVVLMAARRLDDFKVGGIATVVLQGKVSAFGIAQHADLGYLDWWPCNPTKSLKLSLTCSRVEQRAEPSGTGPN